MAKGMSRDRRSTAGAPLLSPYLAVIWRETDVMIRLSDRLGFSPVTRPRIQIEPEPPRGSAADDNVWAELKRFPVINGGKTERSPATPLGRRNRDAKAKA
jgi:hypothetical protein